VDATTLAQDCRSSCLEFPDPDTAAKAVRDPLSQPELRDAALLAIVRAYRADSQWGSVLVDLLRAEISNRLRRMRPRPPVIRDGDLRQQMVVEVLEAAAEMPMPPETRHVDRRIVRRAGWKLLLWLRSEALYQEATEPLPDPDDEDDSEGEDGA
jgi:hypothetical protein